MATPQDAASSAIMPLYRRIHDDLRRDIESGRYVPGDRLPSESELAGLYGVSRITSRQALDLLSTEGLLVRRQGMGSFVAPVRVTQPLVRLTDFMEDMAGAGLRPESRVLAFEPAPAPDEVARHLQIPDEGPSYRLDRLRLANGSPIALDMTWMPPHIAKLLMGEDLTGRTIYSILEGNYGIPIVSGEYVIQASVAARTHAQLLGVRSGAPLLRFERVSLTTGSKPIYFQTRLYRADRVQYRLVLSRASTGDSAIESFTPVFEG
jgi:GntR family transcriptional regulator